MSGLELERVAVPQEEAYAYARLVQRYGQLQRAVSQAPNRKARRKAERELQDAAEELAVEARRLKTIGRSVQ